MISAIANNDVIMKPTSDYLQDPAPTPGCQFCLFYPTVATLR